MTSQDIFAKLTTILVEQLNLAHEHQVTEDSTFEELGADSLDVVEIIMAIEEDFVIEIPDEEAKQIKTVEQAVAHIERALAA